jgi:hypothetical protein
MVTEPTNYREDIEQLRRRLAEFRQTHALRSRLPAALWAAAAKLAQWDGIAATARALRVERPSLQKWVDRFEPLPSTRCVKLHVGRRGARVAHRRSWNRWRLAPEPGTVAWWRLNRVKAASCGWS